MATSKKSSKVPADQEISWKKTEKKEGMQDEKIISVWKNDQNIEKRTTADKLVKLG